jgi:hypothetical protein
MATPPPSPPPPPPSAQSPSPPPYRNPVLIDSKPTREGQKTRQFRADLLTAIAAPTLWELGATNKENTLRPVLLAYAATDQESRAFTANLRAGHSAVEDSTSTRTLRLKFEVPRSAGFRFETHSREGGTLTLAYLPAAFALQPAATTTEPGAISFLCMPPTWWVDREAATLAASGLLRAAEDPREAAHAAYFVAYLDQRTPLPIANDPRFHLHLYRAALASDWCHAPGTAPRQIDHLYAEGYAALGFERPFLVETTHAAFAAFLAEQTANHLPREEAIPHGAPRGASPRRLLSDPARAAAQLGLFG